MNYRTLSKDEFRSKYGNEAVINNLDYSINNFPVEPIYFEVNKFERDYDGDIYIKYIPELRDNKSYSNGKSYIIDDVIVRVDLVLDEVKPRLDLDEDDWKTKLEKVVKDGIERINTIESNIKGMNHSLEEQTYDILNESLSDLGGKLKYKIKAELKAELKTELKAELKDEMKSELTCIQSDLKDYVVDNNSEELSFMHDSLVEHLTDVTSEIKEELREEFKENTNEVENEFPIGKVVVGVTFVGIGIYLFNKLR